MKVVSKALFGGSVSSRSIEDVEESTFITVKDPSKKYTSFAWRIVLSAIIATAGIAVDSPAVVIGAMLVAPLVSPMLGTTFALASSNWKGVGRTLVITLLGALACILTAILMMLILPVGINITTDPEITSRTAPRIADLVAALASGLMGAIALTRDDIPDALAGVAIAISLVPPLCVVGICIYYQSLTATLGALTLFLVNYFAIQVTGLIAFFASNLRKKALEAHGRTHSRATGALITCILVGIVVVSIPLAQTSLDAAHDNALDQTVSTTTNAWLEGSNYKTKSVDVSHSGIAITIAGNGETPSTETLKQSLQDKGIADESISVTVLQEFVF